MESKPRFDIRRREVVTGAAGALMAGQVRAAPRAKIVTILGDSVTAGFGLPAADALPAQLGLALGRLGVLAQVRGAGVSGDTTADGLARVDFSVRDDTDIAVVELGANDLLQGVDPAVVQANLTAILRRLRARRIPTVLAGMQAPTQIGSSYARAFDAAFPAAARAGGAVLYPYLFTGVGRDVRLLQRDAVHPNPAGVKIVAARLAPVVAAVLARASRR
jgi:acyl-CoA thioesterase-1